MRRWAVCLMLVLLAPALSGCIGTDDDLEQASTDLAGPLELDTVPPGATVEPIENGLQLVWEAADLPFSQEIEVPEGTTMVRVTGEVGASEVVAVHLSNADTGRRRCNVPAYEDGWFEPSTGVASCAGLTAMDPKPANWTAEVFGQPVEADLVKVELLTTPVDGIAGQIDLTQLSMPTHELQETEPVTIESFDGTSLYAEVTLPEGPGPWPTILVSSPYNSGNHQSGVPSQWEYVVQDWAKRGYAMVVADVRGTGYSGGCMEVWGPNEQQDQVALVEWAADQPWSTGDVGFYGQSYVATTPVEAAVRTPEALDAIIAVAPVNNAYEDWHFGGVPNGENALSPAFYQASTGGASDLDMNDPVATALDAANGVCDPSLTARANDPRAVYDEFYEVRNFSAEASKIEAATLYTHGFEDVNVKSAMADPFFNAIDAPKLALLGHWVHQHPIRADQEVMFLAWMDQYVKGKAMGLEEVPAVDVVVGDGTHRTADAWPPEDPKLSNWYPDLSEGELNPSPTDGSATIVLDPTSASQTTGTRTEVVLEVEAEEPIHLAGKPTVKIVGELQGASNAHLAGFLYHITEDGTDLATFGMANLAHRDGHESYEPVPPAETVTMRMPFVPTERVIEPGDTMRLVLRAVEPGDWSSLGGAGPVTAGGAQAGPAGTFTFQAGADGTELSLPLAPSEGVAPLPVSAGR